MEISNTKTNIPVNICDLNNQKSVFEWGLKYIEILNNKLVNFEIGSAKNGESILIVKIIEIYGGQKIERTYSHTGITMLFDEFNGVVFIFSMKFVTYFRAAFPLEIGMKIEKKLKSDKL